MLSSAPKRPPIFVGGFFGVAGRVRTRVLSRVRNYVRATDNFKIFIKNIDEWKKSCYNNRKRYSKEPAVCRESWFLYAFLGILYGKKEEIHLVYNTNYLVELSRYHLAWKRAFGVAY